MKTFRFIIFTFSFLILVTQSYAQTTEDRLNALEDYVATFQETLLDFAKAQDNQFTKYSDELNQNLTDYTQRLQAEVDDQLKSVNRRTIVIDANSDDFQTIETNTGSFLISVNKLEQVVGGYKLHLNIGNPNYANYKGYKIKFVYGKKYHSAIYDSYEHWHNTLKGMEFTFESVLRKGNWNAVILDIPTDDSGNLAHIECEMEIISVEMQAL